MSLLDPGLVASGYAVVDEILSEATAHLDTADLSLGFGLAGRMVALSEGGRRLGDARYHAAAATCFSRIVDEFDEVPWRTSLMGGLPGVLWALEHTAEAVGRDPDELDALDDGILAILESASSSGPFEFLDGLAAFTPYLVRRARRTRAAASALEVLGRRLTSLDSWQPAVGAWRTMPSHAPAPLSTDHPDGYFNFGMAHGVAGALAALTRIGWTRRKADDELDAAVRSAAHFMADEIRATGGRRCFSFGGSPAREAWCYGLPGGAFAVLAASSYLEDESLCVGLIDRVLSQESISEAMPPNDGTLCHGFAGLALQYRRLHAITGDPRLSARAEFHLDRLLAFRGSRGGPCGFAALGRDGEQLVWRSHRGLLMGTCGIALALLGLEDESEPGWVDVLGLVV